MGLTYQIVSIFSRLGSARVFACWFRRLAETGFAVDQLEQKSVTDRQHRETGALPGSMAPGGGSLVAGVGIVLIRQL
jgi:hypothetical protein